MHLSERFIKSGGHFNSEICRVLVAMDIEGIKFTQDDKEFTKLIRSIAVELNRLDKLDIGLKALQNTEGNN